jgi:hypothetical protein
MTLATVCGGSGEVVAIHAIHGVAVCLTRVPAVRFVEQTHETLPSYRMKIPQLGRITFIFTFVTQIMMNMRSETDCPGVCRPSASKCHHVSSFARPTDDDT